MVAGETLFIQQGQGLNYVGGFSISEEGTKLTLCNVLQGPTRLQTQIPSVHSHHCANDSNQVNGLKWQEGTRLLECLIWAGFKWQQIKGHRG